MKEKFANAAPFLWTCLLYVIVINFVEQGSLRSIRLTQYFALSALAVLIVTLVIDLFLRLSPRKNKQLNKLFPSFIFSAFFLALVHASFGLFTQLGGIQGLLFLSGKFLYAIILAALALLLLIMSRLLLIRAVLPLVGVFVLIHAFIIGTHFADLSDSLPQIIFLTAAGISIGYAIVLDKWLTKNHTHYPKVGVASIAVCCFVLYLGITLQPEGTSSGRSLSLHAEHNRASSNPIVPKRYTASIIKPELILPNTSVEIGFEIYEAGSGMQINNFTESMEMLMHLIVVDSQLHYFNHVHPELDEGRFRINLTFPHEGRYHLYTDFVPERGPEQQIGFTVIVGDTNLSEKKWTVDTSPKRVSDYQVAITLPNTLRANEMTAGKQSITFTISEPNQEKEFKRLRPYLGAYGHLVMIHSENFEYLHVHPINQNVAVTGDFGGPTVEFSPMGMFAPIKPGIYRIFAQFNPDGELITTDFTIEVK